MSSEIDQENWKEFFVTLSKRRFEWRTKIELLSSEFGDQTLANGLPLNGITMTTEDDAATIEISLGEGTESHQTHNVKNPVRVAFLASENGFSDVLDIEEADGTKTLIHFIEPMGIMESYANAG